MKQALLLFVTLLGMIAPASAGFVNNYPEWRRMSLAEQRTYLSGIYDQIVTNNLFSRPGAVATVDGLRSCVSDLELEADEMAEIVSGWYEKNPDKWSLPPKIVFHASVIATICKQHIKDARDQYRFKLDGRRSSN